MLAASPPPYRGSVYWHASVTYSLHSGLNKQHTAIWIRAALVFTIVCVHHVIVFSNSAVFARDMPHHMYSVTTSCNTWPLQRILASCHQCFVECDLPPCTHTHTHTHTYSVMLLTRASRELFVWTMTMATCVLSVPLDLLVALSEVTTYKMLKICNRYVHTCSIRSLLVLVLPIFVWQYIMPVPDDPCTAGSISLH